MCGHHALVRFAGVVINGDLGVVRAPAADSEVNTAQFPGTSRVGATSRTSGAEESAPPLLVKEDLPNELGFHAVAGC